MLIITTEYTAVYVDRMSLGHRHYQLSNSDSVQRLSHITVNADVAQRKILRVSWTSKRTNEWVLNKAGVKRELLDSVKARKLAYYGHKMRKQGSCLEKEIMQETMPGADHAWPGWTTSRRGHWRGLPVEELIKMTEDRDKWRKCVDGVANPRIEMAKVQNRTHM